MGRKDGIHNTVTRNQQYARGNVGMTERHNERKNESYHNPDICLECSTRNIHFKHPTDTYLHIFDNLCKDGTISTRGLKPTATITDELIFDVNSATQVSHSKKWVSHKQVDSNGKTTLIRSYSLLQDRFFTQQKIIWLPSSANSPKPKG